MSYMLPLSGTRPLNFFMTDSTDHVTGKTGLSPTVTIRKVAGSFASPSGAVTEIANGWYTVAGNSTDCNTLGPLLLHASATGADPTDTLYDVVAMDVHDGVRMGLTAFPNVASGSAGALLTNGTGTAQLATTSGNVALTSTGNTAVVTELMGTTTENNGTLTFKGLMRLMSAVIMGRVSISGSTVTFKTADNVKTRVTTVTDSSNQRTTVTLDATD
jgi:hypothetical protein